MLTPSDLRSTLGAGLTTEAAAKMLRCTAKTVRRAAAAYGIELRPRHARIRGEQEWLDAFVRHGPSVRGIARAIGLDHRYVAGQLERYGIKETPEGPCVGAQMRLAREPLIRDATGRYVRAEVAA
jgi:hypothetical protein